ncbi:MAG: hypothetical protein NTZ49_01140 [Candidatus Parcubacteria bacterium]|nr:hypothetical protein [Candidatus Parcubacteria bacterium]
MKKLILTVLITITFFAASCTYNYNDNNSYLKDSKINITLSNDSPTDEIPLGDQVLAVFLVNTKNAAQIHGLELDITDNYDDPLDLQFVNSLWIEDGNGNLIYEAQNISDGFDFWGVYNIPIGESAIIVKGHITFGEDYNSQWSPRPEFQVLVNGIYGSEKILPLFGLASNAMIPKFQGITSVFSELTSDSPIGDLAPGQEITLFKFKLWTENGSYLFWDPFFTFTNFNGQLTNCFLLDEQGNKLNDTFSIDSVTNHIKLGRNDSETPWALITASGQTFALSCDVSTNSPSEYLNFGLAGAKWESADINNWLSIPTEYAQGNTLHVVQDRKIFFNLAADTPQQILPGNTVTIMKFSVYTGFGDIKLYLLEFAYSNYQAGSFSNCRVQDENGQKINKFVNGFRPPGTNIIYEAYFFGPSTGVYPGDSYPFTMITPQAKTFFLSCNMGNLPGYSTNVDLSFINYYFRTDLNYEIFPPTNPILTTTVHQ